MILLKVLVFQNTYIIYYIIKYTIVLNTTGNLQNEWSSLDVNSNRFMFYDHRLVSPCCCAPVSPFQELFCTQVSMTINKILAVCSVKHTVRNKNVHIHSWRLNVCVDKAKMIN